MRYRPLLMILLCGGLRAQPPAESGYTRYTRLEGLSNNYVSGIVQDSLGYIWVATHKGLNRFDGRFFTSYYTGSPDIPLPANAINLLKMQDEEMIGATVAGAFAFNTVDHRYLPLVAPVDSVLSFWANNVYEASRDGRGDYVLSTKTGLYVFDPAGKVIDRYDHYHSADAGRIELWYGGSLYTTPDGSVLHEHLSGFSHYDPVLNSIDTLYGNKHPRLAAAIASHAENQVCYAEYQTTLYIFNPVRNTLDLFDLRDSSLVRVNLPFDGKTELDENSSQLFILNDSLLAFTGKQNGFFLMTYDKTAQTLHLSGPKRFDSHQCTVVFLDRESRLWVGTDEGLYKQNLANPLFEAFDLAAESPEAASRNIRAIYADRDYLYIGLRDNGGILVLDKTTKRLKRHVLFCEKGSYCNSIGFFIPFNADTLWVGTSLGLYWLDKHDFSSGMVETPPELRVIKDGIATCFAEDRQGRIWMSFVGLNKVECYDRRSRTWSEVSAEKQPLMRITFCFSITEDKDGNMWFGGDGICRWNARKQAIDTLIPYARVGSVLRNYVSLLDCDAKDNLWLYSPDNGILRFDIIHGSMVMEKAENEITDGAVLSNTSIIHDTLWLATESGMLAFDIRDRSVRLFPFGEGLPPLTMTNDAKAVYYDSAGRLFYLASRRNLFMFRPRTINSSEKVPRLFIDAIGTGGGILPENKDRIDLGYPDNSVIVSFNAVNFSNPEGNRFAYQVSPSADEGWHLLNWQRSVTFSNLSSGNYHIRIKLFSANNRWPEQYKDILLVVHPPIWRNGWFLTAVAVAVLLLIAVLYRNRVARIRERLSLDQQVAEYEMKALHAQMNPHFIFNALNSIREMILHEDNRNASRYLSRFAILIRLNLEHSKQTFITLRQNIDYLEAYLEMEQLRFADFSYRIEVSERLDTNDVKLAPMLIQPLVENAIWHGLLPKAADKWVRIGFFNRHGRLICEIEDSGIGIRQSLKNKTESQAAHQSVGIGNIRRRMEVLNEKYHISCSLTIMDKSDIPDRTDSGTLIILELPAHEEEEFMMN
jgi:ligand-binding sensor domain-containing protein